jgi:hypothetical protein
MKRRSWRATARIGLGIVMPMLWRRLTPTRLYTENTDRFEDGDGGAGEWRRPLVPMTLDAGQLSVGTGHGAMMKNVFGDRTTQIKLIASKPNPNSDAVLGSGTAETFPAVEVKYV